MAGTATTIEPSLVADVLDAQRRKIEAARGVEQLFEKDGGVTDAAAVADVEADDED